MTNYNAITSMDKHDVEMFTSGRIVLRSPKRAHVDLNWPILREKVLKMDWSVKMPLQSINFIYLKHGKWLSKLVFRHAV